MMRFGCCADIRRAQEVYAAGYDYLECTVVSLKPEVSDTEFQQQIYPSFEASPLPIETFNVLLPGDLEIVGDTVDQQLIDRYLENALERVKVIGADTIVFGSGAARSLPEGFSHEKGKQQIFGFLNRLADHAERAGVTIVIEPLNSKETNMIRSVSEAVEWAELVNKKSLKVLADFYHMQEENDPLDTLVVAGEWLRHIHVADSGRYAPGTGNYPYDYFFEYLRQIGYDNRISVEGKWNDFKAEAEAARKFLQRQIS